MAVCCTCVDVFEAGLLRTALALIDVESVYIIVQTFMAYLCSHSSRPHVDRCCTVAHELLYCTKRVCLDMKAERSAVAYTEETCLSATFTLGGSV